MFFAESLRQKLDSDNQYYLKGNQDCLFPYKFSKNNNTTLLAELKTDNPDFTHIQLKQMSNKDYLRNFSKKNLIKKWNRKCKVNCSFTTNKFTLKLDNKTLEAKKYVKNLVDKDIFNRKIPRWNNSTKTNDDSENINIKEYLKQIKYEAEHCNKNQIINNITNRIDNDVQDVIHDYINIKWNISSKLEKKEKEIIDKELYLQSLNNTQKYWLKNNFSNYKNCKKISNGYKNKNNKNKCNNDFIAIKNKQINDSANQLKTIKLFEEKKNNISLYENYVSQQKFLRRSNSCYYFIKKKKISDLSQYKKAISEWNDKELIEKIKLIEDWSEPKINCKMNKTFRPNELKKEMLKNLIQNREKIQKEQEKIKEENDYKNLIEKIKYLKIKKRISPLNYSKYPMPYKQKSSDGNKSQVIDGNKVINDDENKYFIEACQRIIFEENKKNKTLKRCLSCKNVEYNKRKIIYFHPGVYRQFNYSLNSVKKDGKNSIIINEEKYMAWSCCNNKVKKSKGCQKKEF